MTGHQAQKWILFMKKSSESLAKRQLCVMDYESDTVQRAGVIHQAANALSCLTTTNECAEPMEDDIPHNGQFITTMNHPRSILTTRYFFELEVDERLEVLPVVWEDIQFAFIVGLADAQKADSLCGRLTATGGKLGTQFGTEEIVILLRRGIIDSYLQKVAHTKRVDQCIIKATIR